MRITFVLFLILVGQNSLAHAEGTTNGRSPASQATYSVPVSPALQPFATYPIAPPQVTSSASEVVVTYQLPAELVGRNSPPIIFRGQATTYGTNHFLLSGANGHADCEKLAASTRCQVAFQNLHVDFASAAEQIKMSSLSSTEISARMQIARSFGGDPVGVLEY
jgi:hypothetical protein